MPFDKRIALMLIPILAACGGTVVTGTGGMGTTGATGGTGGTGDTGCSIECCLDDADCATGEICNMQTGACEPQAQPTCKQCACVDLLSMGGCANLCDSTQDGVPNTPNFCNGVSALPQCAKCLMDNCAAEGADPSDPTACM